MSINLQNIFKDFHDFWNPQISLYCDPIYNILNLENLDNGHFYTFFMSGWENGRQCSEMDGNYSGIKKWGCLYIWYRISWSYWRFLGWNVYRLYDQENLYDTFWGQSQRIRHSLPTGCFWHRPYGAASAHACQLRASSIFEICSKLNIL